MNSKFIAKRHKIFQHQIGRNQKSKSLRSSPNFNNRNVKQFYSTNWMFNSANRPIDLRFVSWKTISAFWSPFKFRNWAWHFGEWTDERSILISQESKVGALKQMLYNVVTWVWFEYFLWLWRWQRSIHSIGVAVWARTMKTRRVETLKSFNLLIFKRQWNFFLLPWKYVTFTLTFCLKQRFVACESTPGIGFGKFDTSIHRFFMVQWYLLFPENVISSHINWCLIMA